MLGAFPQNTGFNLLTRTPHDGTNLLLRMAPDMWEKTNAHTEVEMPGLPQQAVQEEIERLRDVCWIGCAT